MSGQDRLSKIVPSEIVSSEIVSSETVIVRNIY